MITPVIATINGHKMTFRSKHDLARYLMDILVDSVSPLFARAENLKKIMELIGLEGRAKFLGMVDNENRYTEAYWETLLAMENLGTLPGFSVSCNIEKGNSNFSPEHKRISEDWTI